MVWVSVQNFSFQYLRKNYHKANCHHICLLHMHAHVYQYISLSRFWYKINISICHVSGIKSMSICHASDTGQNYFSKKCFLQSWNGLLLLWHFPLLSDIFKRGFCALESYCIQRKENDNIINLFPCFLRKKLFFFFLSGFYTFKKKQLLSLINLFCGKTYCDALMQHSSITYKFWSSVTVTMPWIEFHVLW